MLVYLQTSQKGTSSREPHHPSHPTFDANKIYSIVELLVACGVAYRPHIAPRNHSYAAPNVVDFVFNYCFIHRVVVHMATTMSRRA